jgi:hypothetical protein
MLEKREKPALKRACKKDLDGKAEVVVKLQPLMLASLIAEVIV